MEFGNLKNYLTGQTHVGWPLLTTALDVTEEAITHSDFPLPHSATPLTALLRAGHCFGRRCPSPRHRAPPAPRACLQHRLAKPSHGISPSSSSSMSASPVIARFDCSPTPPTPQEAPRCPGAPPRPLLRPPRLLLQPLTDVSSLSTHAPP
jgi:hypothetical protein